MCHSERPVSSPLAIAKAWTGCRRWRKNLGTDTRTHRRGPSYSRDALGPVNAKTAEVRSMSAHSNCFTKTNNFFVWRYVLFFLFVPVEGGFRAAHNHTTPTTRHRTPRKQNRLTKTGRSAPAYGGHNVAPPCRPQASSRASSPFEGCTHHSLLVFGFGLLLYALSSRRKSCGLL